MIFIQNPTLAKDFATYVAQFRVDLFNTDFEVALPSADWRSWAANFILSNNLSDSYPYPSKETRHLESGEDKHR